MEAELNRIYKKIDDIHTEIQTLRISKDAVINQRDRAQREVVRLQGLLEKERARHNKATELIKEMKKKSR